MTSYDGVSASHTLTVATDALGNAGTIYRLKVRAKNADNVFSNYSDTLIVALGSVPAAPSKPTKNNAASGAGEIAVQWSALTSETLPVYGYRLYCDMASDDTFTVVFDGRSMPQVTEYLLTNVTDTNQTYKFKVTATNFNGEGPASDIAHLKACTLPSSGADGGFAAPNITAVSSTSISISWTEPADNGGCKINGYAVYVDNANLVFAEYDAVNVRDKPFLNSYTIDMNSLGKTPGLTYRFRVGVYNDIGEVQSDMVTVLLAGVPVAPAAPTKQLLNSSYMDIVMAPPTSDGGDMIISYQL